MNSFFANWNYKMHFKTVLTTVIVSLNLNIIAWIASSSLRIMIQAIVGPGSLSVSFKLSPRFQLEVVCFKLVVVQLEKRQLISLPPPCSSPRLLFSLTPLSMITTSSVFDTMSLSLPLQVRLLFFSIPPWPPSHLYLIWWLCYHICIWYDVCRLHPSPLFCLFRLLGNYQGLYRLLPAQIIY